MLYDNPAERLKLILQKGKAAPRTASCKDTWAYILGVDPTDNIAVLARIGGVMELARCAKNLIKIHAPSQIGTVDHWSGQILNAFAVQQLGGTWSTFIDQIQADSIAMLSLTAEMLNNKLSVKVIQVEDLKNITTSFSELLIEIQNSSIADSLKVYLQCEIVELLQKISEYQISGALPIIRQTESMVGHIAFAPEYKDFLKENSIGQKLQDCLATVSNLTTITSSLPQLSQVISALIK